jgi:SpoVK/Ycf46/Vps4 family AAA+-type ATPase
MLCYQVVQALARPWPVRSLLNELGRDLFKIDLSGVISKYIGETEKNLDRILSAAAKPNANLFFDEADALFGMRSEVPASHDRYANIKIGYLLQRVKAYEGIAILVTNLRVDIDEGFMHRFAFSVSVPFPNEASPQAPPVPSFGQPQFGLDRG